MSCHSSLHYLHQQLFWNVFSVLALKDKRFEMAVLIAVNNNLINDVVPSEKTTQKIVESVMALFDKESDPISGLNEEAKNLLDPYHA